MSDGVAVMAGANDWSKLLTQTRLALSTLRADELEDLAALAEHMFNLSAECGSSPRDNAEWAAFTCERRLLGELLAATDINLQVLRRLRSRSHSPGASMPWVR